MQLRFPQRAVLLAAIIASLPSSLRAQAHPTIPQVPTLHEFTNNGTFPNAPLVRDGDGNFYGTTQTGAHGAGVIFKLTSAGTIVTLHDFAGADGADPAAGLILASDGALYGTTSSGGSDFVAGAGFNDNGTGVIFRLEVDGTDFSVLYNFNASDDITLPAQPLAPLLQGQDGAFYGTTFGGGTANLGTVFKLSADGQTFTKVAEFDGTNGAYPVAGLIQTQDGTFYGTTQGASNYDGSAFRMTAGVLTKMADFPPTNGAAAGPAGPLMLASNGVFYGTTETGGATQLGSIFSLTLGGTLTTVYSFNTGVDEDGEYPKTGLVQGSDGALYGGTTYAAGQAGYAGSGPGVLFRFTLDGDYSIIAEPAAVAPIGSSSLSTLYEYGGATGSLLLGPGELLYGALGSTRIKRSPS